MNRHCQFIFCICGCAAWGLRCYLVRGILEQIMGARPEDLIPDQGASAGVALLYLVAT